MRSLIRVAGVAAVLGLVPLLSAESCGGSAAPATSTSSDIAPVGGDSLPPGASPSPRAADPTGPSLTLPEPTLTKPPPTTEPEDSGAPAPSTDSAP
jgi:hypothetical protein